MTNTDYIILNHAKIPEPTKMSLKHCECHSPGRRAFRREQLLNTTSLLSCHTAACVAPQELNTVERQRKREVVRVKILNVPKSCQKHQNNRGSAKQKSSSLPLAYHRRSMWSHWVRCSLCTGQSLWGWCVPGSPTGCSLASGLCRQCWGSGGSPKHWRSLQRRTWPWAQGSSALSVGGRTTRQEKKRKQESKGYSYMYIFSSWLIYL